MLSSFCAQFELHEWGESGSSMEVSMMVQNENLAE